MEDQKFYLKGRSQGNLRDYYRIGKLLGSGALGEARVCSHRETGVQRVVKVIRKTKMSAEQIEHISKEIELMNSIDHPNILKLYEFFEEEKRIYLIIAMGNGLDLFDEIQKRGKWKEADAAIVIKSLLATVNYLHSKGIVHRDIKPENITLENLNRLEMIKLNEFEQAERMDPKNKFTDKVGTPYYIAPEVIAQNYDNKCDIWSIGVIAYILLSGNPPFKGDSEQDILNAVSKGTFGMVVGWGGVTDQAKDFVKQLLTVDPNVRPNAANALTHPWFQKFGFQPLEETVAKAALNQLKAFRNDDTLKAATFNFICSQLLNKKEKDNLGMTFRLFDKSCSGSLSMNELGEAFKTYKVDITQNELELLFYSIDQDKSGEISFTEYMVAAMSSKTLTSEDKLQAAFRLFDKDGSGLVSTQELKIALSKGDDEDFMTTVSEFDSNGDGEISFDEFVLMMKKIGI